MAGSDTIGERSGAAASLAPGAISALLGELARLPEERLEDWTAALRPGLVVDRFELLREIGRGGFGVVFEARDRALGRLVAFKAILPGTRIAARIREEGLLREAEAVAQLNHPNVCTLYDLGRGPGGPYLVLELLHGETLEQLLSRGPLPAERALAVVTEVARALAHAHASGVLHRDLKPSNVSLEASGSVKVLDFGLARVFGAGAVAPSGTPAYMAPEQWRGESEDARTDVFALGVVLFEMLAGKPPFQVSRDRSTVLDPGPAPALPPGRVPPAIASLVARMLSKDPGDRPANGQVLLEELLRLQAERAEVEVAVPARARRRAWLWAAAAAATAAGLALGFVGASRLRAADDRSHARIAVAVADFANETGDRDLDGLSGLLITSLEQSRRLSVMTRGRMAETLRRLGREKVERIDEGLARDVGREARLGALILASVRRFGGLYTVELKALDPLEDQYLFTLKEEGTGKDSVPGIIDRLSERTRRALRERASDIRAAQVKVADVTTPSLEAFRHYFEGLRLDDEYLWDSAAIQYHEAVRIDPGFALAHARLASGDVLVHPTRDRAEHLRSAMSHADRLPEPDRLAVRAESEILERRLDEAAALLEKSLVLRPDDKRLLLRLAAVKARDGFAEARPIAERALALDPSFVPAQDMLLAAYAWTGQVRKCEDFALENVRRWPSPLTYANLNGCRLWAGDYRGALAVERKADDLFGAAAVNNLALDLLLVGDFERAVVEARRLRAGLPDGANDRILADVLRTTGRRAEAGRILDAMEGSGAGWMALQARVRHAAGDGDPARLRSLARQAAPDEDLPLLALTLAFAGEVEEAERILWQYPMDRLGRYGVFGRTAALDVLAALRDRERGDVDAARRRLEAARRRAIVPFAFAIDYFLGETCHLAGDDRRAVEALSEGRRLLLHWGFPRAVAYPRSLLMLAGSLERLGKHAEAARAVDRLLALWRHADPDLPLLAEAKALRKRLAAGASTVQAVGPPGAASGLPAAAQATSPARPKP